MVGTEDIRLGLSNWRENDCLEPFGTQTVDCSRGPRLKSHPWTSSAIDIGEMGVPLIGRVRDILAMNPSCGKKKKKRKSGMEHSFPDPVSSQKPFPLYLMWTSFSIHGPKQTPLLYPSPLFSPP
mmetsp:Transcript_16570/g.33927  ORF Transcript_16570/g.33927 Transcript_16570/m.33927 type:complete len:124 (+) Transcript_16570:2556-2927(+)